MMLVPRRNTFDLFDEFFDDDIFPKHEVFTKKERNLMKTDIKEKKDRYVLDIDLPGFDKENINISLNNGYTKDAAEYIENHYNKYKNSGAKYF